MAEPKEVNTVSKSIVSAEKASFRFESGLMLCSFLQEKAATKSMESMAKRWNFFMRLDFAGKDKLLSDTNRNGNYCIFAQNSREMKRFGIIAALSIMLLGFSGKVSAQFFADVPNMKGKFIFGGNLGFGMSGNYLDLSLSPQVGYRVFNPWEVGVRGTYKLQCFFHPNANSVYYHYFGAAPYTNVQFFRGLFVHVEYEMLYGLTRYHHQTEEQRLFKTLFGGVGYRQYSIGGGYAFLMVLYNFSYEKQENWDRMYPYYSPIEIRVGFCF